MRLYTAIIPSISLIFCDNTYLCFDIGWNYGMSGFGISKHDTSWGSDFIMWGYFYGFDLSFRGLPDNKLTPFVEIKSSSSLMYSFGTHVSAFIDNEKKDQLNKANMKLPGLGDKTIKLSPDQFGSVLSYGQHSVLNAGFINKKIIDCKILFTYKNQKFDTENRNDLGARSYSYKGNATNSDIARTMFVEDARSISSELQLNWIGGTLELFKYYKDSHIELSATLLFPCSQHIEISYVFRGRESDLWRSWIINIEAPNIGVDINFNYIFKIDFGYFGLKIFGSLINFDFPKTIESSRGVMPFWWTESQLNTKFMLNDTLQAMSKYLFIFMPNLSVGMSFIYCYSQ